ncbi:GxxExxY protein [Chitiniphilus eburneus]|uniref:GxxExxY protein n=1 Tax=Chitiniphilus eburneus TaxID=2571148 RepID=UPI001FEB96C4|nr:GxxExxY protein [Chitiniphilus eburneus]
MLSEIVIGAALEVHKALGPGLLESTCEECLAHELALRGLKAERQCFVPLDDKNIHIPNAFKARFLGQSKTDSRNESGGTVSAVARSPVTYLFTPDRLQDRLVDQFQLQTTEERNSQAVTLMFSVCSVSSRLSLCSQN